MLRPDYVAPCSMVTTVSVPSTKAVRKPGPV
jgi:hypothetical protein